MSEPPEHRLLLCWRRGRYMLCGPGPPPRTQAHPWWWWLAAGVFFACWLPLDGPSERAAQTIASAIVILPLLVALVHWWNTRATSTPEGPDDR